jgi:hypothetical protein
MEINLWKEVMSSSLNEPTLHVLSDFVVAASTCDGNTESFLDKVKVNWIPSTRILSHRNMNISLYPPQIRRNKNQGGLFCIA